MATDALSNKKFPPASSGHIVTHFDAANKSLYKHMQLTHSNSSKTMRLSNSHIPVFLMMWNLGPTSME